MEYRQKRKGSLQIKEKAEILILAPNPLNKLFLPTNPSREYTSRKGFTMKKVSRIREMHIKSVINLIRFSILYSKIDKTKIAIIKES